VVPPTKPTLIAVDWGTSSLRIWLMDRAGAVLAERRSAEGMAAVDPQGFEHVLRARLAELGVDPDDEANRGFPVIMCGMVGARQGWREAPYVDVPVNVADIAHSAVEVGCGALDVRIMPGLSRRDPHHPDVIRGEETQLLGMCVESGPRSALVVIPGTHSKWVRLSAGRIADFRTVMTGEIYALLCRHSVLRHTIGEDHDVTATADFAAGVRAGLDEPAKVLASAFAVRAGELLFGLTGAAAAAWLSGLLIGAEVGASLADASDPEVIVLGAGALAGLYAHAVTAAGRHAVMRDAEGAARVGLREAARSSWPAL
jgi:2-dehydro-3-deoxygalactonokinase